jgi:serine/threonine protein phosphatase PrpC
VLIPSSDTHTAYTRHERIVRLGGEIEHGGVAAPGGGQFLKCARSLGDAAYKVGERTKQLVPAEPDVRSIKLKPADAFVLVASDGVWDVFSDQQVTLTLNRGFLLTLALILIPHRSSPTLP